MTAIIPRGVRRLSGLAARGPDDPGYAELPPTMVGVLYCPACRTHHELKYAGAYDRGELCQP